MKVFITGATGFVGRNLLFWLLENRPDLQITCLTRDPGRAEPMASHPNLSWLPGTLEDPQTYARAVERAELVFHAAALVKLRNGPEFFPANVETTQNLINVAHHCERLQRFVFVGSIAAYDRPWGADGHVVENGPLNETSYPYPRTDYGKSKLAAQELVESSGLPYAVAVPAYIYGPYPRPNSSMDRFIQDAAGQRPYTRLPFPGRASEIYSEDLAEILWLLATHAQAKNEVFFTANPEPANLAQAFEAVYRELGIAYHPRTPTPGELSRLQSFLYAREPDNPLLRILFEDYFWCSAEKLFERLDYRPRYGFEEGVKRTVRWYRAQGLLP